MSQAEKPIDPQAADKIKNPSDAALPAAAPEKASRRKIPGGLPYTSSPGVLRRVVDRIPTSEKPDVFGPDFLSTVMGATGGASRPIIPILKAMGFLNQSGSPTDLYAQFQTESGRASAALQALRTGYSEIFRRNQYANKADEAAVTDIIVSITGLPKKDAIVKYILSTFQVFQDLARSAADDGKNEDKATEKSLLRDEPDEGPAPANIVHARTGHLGLVYNINIVLPETTNIEVYNSIFRSIKSSLMS